MLTPSRDMILPSWLPICGPLSDTYWTTDGDLAMMLRFDENDLISRLARLQERARACFAAACAERLYSLYSRYSASADAQLSVVLRNALDYQWKMILDSTLAE